MRFINSLPQKFTEHEYIIDVNKIKTFIDNLHNNIETYIQIYHTSNIQQGLLFSFK